MIVERGMNIFGSSIGSCYSDISDSNLEHTVRSLVVEYPNVGLSVQLGRICETMRSVDQHGALLSALSLRVIYLQSYHISGPLAC